MSQGSMMYTVVQPVCCGMCCGMSSQCVEPAQTTYMLWAGLQGITATFMRWFLAVVVSVTASHVYHLLLIFR